MLVPGVTVPMRRGQEYHGIPLASPEHNSEGLDGPLRSLPQDRLRRQSRRARGGDWLTRPGHARRGEEAVKRAHQMPFGAVPAPGWGRRLYALGVTADTWSALPAWSAVWYLREGPTQDE